MASQIIGCATPDVECASNRVVFNVKGNDYRLVVSVRYDLGLMYVRFIGTHRGQAQPVVAFVIDHLRLTPGV
jgi:mRNA-degrading endonuclease HigB of HigAB toxin-antitoxin module